MELREKVDKLTSIYNRLGNSKVTFEGDALCFAGFLDTPVYNMGYVDNALGRRYFLSSRLSDIENISDIHIVLKNYDMANKIYIYTDEVKTIDFEDFSTPLTFYYKQEDYYASVYIERSA